MEDRKPLFAGVYMGGGPGLDSWSPPPLINPPQISPYGGDYGDNLDVRRRIIALHVGI